MQTFSPKSLYLWTLHIYKRFISPVFVQVFGHSCRFTPTCSEYLIQSVKKFGILKGTFKGTKRFLRCNPLFKGGFDPA